MLHVALNDLIEYTDWQRAHWLPVLQQAGPAAMTISAGPHGDGRFDSVGTVIRHIFSAEQRYVERLAGRPLTDTASLPVTDAAALFAFGRGSRAELRGLVESFPQAHWEEMREFVLGKTRVRATPRKILLHIVVHEIRHWAQVATLLRLQGVKGGPQDLLISPVLGGTVAE